QLCSETRYGTDTQSFNVNWGLYRGVIKALVEHGANTRFMSALKETDLLKKEWVEPDLRSALGAVGYSTKPNGDIFSQPRPAAVLTGADGAGHDGMGLISRPWVDQHAAARI